MDTDLERKREHMNEVAITQSSTHKDAGSKTSGINSGTTAQESKQMPSSGAKAQDKASASGSGTPVAYEMGTMGDLSESSRQVVEDLRTLGASVGQLAQEARNSLQTMAEERPYAAIAVVAGFGFLIAGGLGTRVTASLLGIGGRMLVRSVIAGVGAKALAGVHAGDQM